MIAQFIIQLPHHEITRSGSIRPIRFIRSIRVLAFGSLGFCFYLVRCVSLALQYYSANLDKPAASCASPILRTLDYDLVMNRAVGRL